uniref:Leucine rich repeats and immunoglobulin like domains 1 n=1 Tax=Scleropages formosus TaxID=113540 RepID=A0A8C9V6I8_SCLFO
MAARRGLMGPLSYCVFYLILPLELCAGRAPASGASCAANCSCSASSVVDCSGAGLTDIPRDLPAHTVSLNLSHNKLRTVDASALATLPNLHRIHKNEWGFLTLLHPSFSRHHNKIQSIEFKQLKDLSSLETLDLSNNEISEVRVSCFPAGLRIKDLYLASNKISYLEMGAFNNLSSSLQILRLSRNRLTHLPVKAFQLPRLTQLELNRNRLRLIEGLTFQGLGTLEVLKLQRNNISKLTDGAFWGLAKMKALHLDYNSLTEVNSGSLYGLSSLLQLFLSNNSISHIKPDGWRFCPGLRELNLSYNNLTRLEEGSLAVLGDLQTLRLGHNSINHIVEGAFRGLRGLRLLELDHNDISGTIEDTNGAFAGLESLNKLTLFGNKIKSVAKKAFSGLEALEHLNLGENAIRSIQIEAFVKMKSLRDLDDDVRLCEHLCFWRWRPTQPLFSVVQHLFLITVVCMCRGGASTASSMGPLGSPTDDLPKPQITVQPETTVAVLGKDVRLSCTAASSSSSPMTFAWRKDQELLREAEVENFAHVRARDGDVMEYTTILHLRHVTFAHEGRYQCIITNHFGSSYSSKARLTVHVLPWFVKTPRDITVRTGTPARLECAAKGHPAPEIAWQKDGGTDFPAARERRMHVMPDDDVFFIMGVKPEDMGVYSCTAQNTAGTATANATLTVLETPHLAQELEDRSVAVGETVALQCKALGSPPPRVTWLKEEEPLRLTERHHFTPGNQLLVIRAAEPEDAGRYTCVMSNTLGTERAHSQLTVRHSAPCSTHGSRADSAVAVGVIVIAVVTSIVVTSLVWVCIIYQTRKKSEECSVTNTDETIVPPDVPSYLSSQGTLSDRQDVCIRVESNNRSHPNGHVAFDGTVVCTDLLDNISSYTKDSNYIPQGLQPTDIDYLEKHREQEYSQLQAEEIERCNGSPGVKSEVQTLMFPSNHDRMALPKKQPDSKGNAGPSAPLTTRSVPPTEETFHKPVRLARGPPHLRDTALDTRQALLSNGHPPRSCDFLESD